MVAQRIFLAIIYSFFTLIPCYATYPKTQKLINEANKEGPYLGLVIPNLFEMNPRLQHPTYKPSNLTIDFAVKRRHYNPASAEHNDTLLNNIWYIFPADGVLGACQFSLLPNLQEIRGTNSQIHYNSSLFGDLCPGSGIREMRKFKHMLVYSSKGDKSITWGKCQHFLGQCCI